MTNPQINIASLSFDDIKASLKDYITNQDGSPFSSYTGSAFDSLLDIFAYNTLFYSFYSNMVANESFLDTATLENNIISLIKPLGVLVPGKSCSAMGITASVPISKSVVSYSTIFSGTNSSGTFKFYSIDDLNLSSTPTKINLYESNFVAKNIPINVDIPNQKAFLGDTNIDIYTLTVFVNGVKWSKHNNFEIKTGSSDNVYFVDRTTSGFYLIFGKKTINDYQSSFGKNVSISDVVTISYLSPSGTISNGISSIVSAGIVVNQSSISTGGTDGVNLELYRNFAPKLFASNDRAVTKDDYYGVLLQYPNLPSLITTKEQINVWGGDELNPPIYGRVFVSFAGESLSKDTASVVQSMEYIKNKSIVTIIPEYVRMQPIIIKFDITVSNTTDTANTIKNKIETYYNTKTFNNNINDTIIRDIVRSLSNSSLSTINITKTTLNLNVYGSTAIKNVYFKNEFKRPNQADAAGTVVTSGIFSYNSNNITLKDIPTTFNANNEAIFGNLCGFNTADNSNVGILGFVNYESGYITIKPKILPSSATEIGITPKNTNIINMKQELIPTVIVSVTI